MARQGMVGGHYMGYKLIHSHKRESMLYVDIADLVILVIRDREVNKTLNSRRLRRMLKGPSPNIKFLDNSTSFSSLIYKFY